jgi:uronate dehydrogenase
MNGTPQRIVITGGAGTLASMLRPRLARPDRTLHLIDVRDVQPEAEQARGESSARVDLRDLDALTEAFAGASLVIHFGGHARERSWEEILDVNIHGSRNVLEAARRADVPHVIHAVGFARTDAVSQTENPLPRPDSYYGVGKVAMEALGSLYADRFGLHVLSLRIANIADAPHSARGLSLWLSPDDLARAVEAFLQDATPGHHIAWGVSSNTRGVLDARAAHRFGFFAADDAEQFADQVDPTVHSWDDLLAGGFLAPGRELGEPF